MKSANGWVLSAATIVGKGRSLLLGSVFSAAAALVAAPSVGVAAEIRCDSCTTVATAAARARQADVGLHYVFSVSTGAVFRFQVEREPNAQGAYDYYVFQEVVEPDVAYAVAELKEFYDFTGGTMSAYWTIHTNEALPLGSVHPTVRPGADQYALFNWFTGPGSLSWRNFLAMEGATLQAMGATVINILKTVPLGTHVRVVFPDGSEITLSYDQWTNTATIVPGSARDEVGNPIPTSLEEARNIAFNFSADPSGRAAAGMSTWLTRLGARMEGTGVSGMACVDTENQTVCTRF